MDPPESEEGLQVPEAVLQRHLHSRRSGAVVQFLIKWSGLAPELATWEDAEAIQQCFLFAPAWGYARSQGEGGITTPHPVITEPKRSTHSRPKRECPAQNGSVTFANPSPAVRSRNRMEGKEESKQPTVKHNRITLPKPTACPAGSRPTHLRFPGATASRGVDKSLAEPDPMHYLVRLGRAIYRVFSWFPTLGRIFSAGLDHGWKITTTLTS